MSQATKCAILLEISSGAAKRLPFSTESLTDDNIVAILDELHEVIWLWMGKSTGLVMRRGSMRAARSLKAYGHEIGNAIVGRKLKDVIPIDGLKITTDPEEKNNFDQVISLFTREHEIKYDFLAEYQVLAEVQQKAYYGLSKSQRDDLVAAAIAAPSAGDDSRKIEEIVGQFRPPPPGEASAEIVSKPSLKPTIKMDVGPTINPPKPAVKPEAPTVIAPKPAPKMEVAPSVSPPKSAMKTELQTLDIPDTEFIEIPEEKPAAPSPKPAIDEETIGDVKASIVISSVLSEINDVFLGVRTEGGQKIYTVEGPEGAICKFALEKSKIQFLPGSWEKIDPEKKRKIQKLFIDRVKLLIGG
ncbi:MAG: hypothetical protein LUQ65_08085 [Candidatus Helarchaeota archaeon]|nr:hypothetical protein [Candidatus Helarchaeota archaeon]